MKTDTQRYLELATQKRAAAAACADPALCEELIELANAYEKLAELTRRIAMMRSGCPPRSRR